MNVQERSNFWLYILGRFVSLIGTGVQMAAIPLLILDMTGSGTMMGLFAAATSIPRLLIAPFAGVLGDRWNRKKIMVNTDYLRGIIILALAWAAYSGRMSIPLLFVTQIVVALIDSIFSAATSAMLPELVPTDDLTRANSVNSAVVSISMIFGPVLGGVLYGLQGISIVFLVNGVSFLLSGFSEMFIRYLPIPKPNIKLSTTTFFREIKEGFQFITRRKPLLILIIYAVTLNFLVNPIIAVVMPYGMREVIGFSATQFGLMQSLWMVGSLLGNVMIGVFFAKSNVSKLMKRSLVSQMALCLLFSITFFPWVVMALDGPSIMLFTTMGVLFAGSGIFNAMVNVPFFTNMQKMVPNHLRARVFSLLEIMLMMATPFGQFAFGLMTDRFPVHWLMTGTFGIGLLTSIWFVMKAPKASFDPSLMPIGETG